MFFDIIVCLATEFVAKIVNYALIYSFVGRIF